VPKKETGLSLSAKEKKCSNVALMIGLENKNV